MVLPALGVIPARLGSQRLPRKPLHRLAGKPLLQWVWERVRSFDLFAELVVATDAREVADAARAFGACVCMTSAAHPSGTDRVAEVARRPEFRQFELIVNIQGDEPFVSSAALRAPLDLLRSGKQLSTACVPIADAAELRDPSVVKVVRAADGSALYFSRAVVPFARDDHFEPLLAGSDAYLRHVGVYGYRRRALQRWVDLPEGRLEKIERLEQLRPLEAGMTISVALLPAEASGFGIDTPADAVRAEALLQSRSSALAGARR